MSLPVLPPELHIQIIDHVGRPPPTRHLAFKLPPDTTQDLLSLSLVSRDYHVWTTGILYQRISLTPSQLGRLRATLCPKQTEKITRLAKWIKSLSIRWREEDHGGRTTPTVTGGTGGFPATTLRDIALILDITSPNLQRLFLDIDITDQDLNRMLIKYQPFTLNIAISSLTALKEFVFGHSNPTTVYLTLPVKSPIQRLGLIGENIQNGFIERIGAFKNIEQLILFSPWVRMGSSLPDVGTQFARLFSQPICLRRLVLVTTTEHRKVAPLTCEALMEGMIVEQHMTKAKDNVIVTSSREPLSWDVISDLIARGSFQEAGWETFGSQSATRLD